jgi:phenylalanyl-tRNA synthetase beta chain
MKLSLTWIFDHILTSWKDHDIPDLIHRFNTTTAEIEGYEYVTTDLSSFTLVKIVSLGSDSVTAYCAELNNELTLSLRDGIKKDQIYLVKKDKNEWRWAQGQDFKSEKEGLLPELYCSETDFAGLWKDQFEKEDYIITVGNTSITHRPDLWCHRGFAREMAAILGCQLKDEKHFLTDYSVKYSSHTEESSASKALTLSLQTEKCKRIAGLYIPHIANKPSLISIAHRLLRVDSRPINAIVDTTNYVMFDIGQPMHAFDYAKLAQKKIIVTQAREGEQLTLLDGQTIELTHEDNVITDGIKPVTLAGIMGGVESSVGSTTQSVVIEAANLDAAAVRHSSTRFKIRTESSTRFEKSLDPTNVTTALMRFLHLLEKNDIHYTAQDEIVCLGKELKTEIIELSHAFIEKKLGVQVEQQFVVKTLEVLGFDVQINAKSEIRYTLKVPSWRATKDIFIPEDVVEEIGRFFGFDNIPHQLPSLPTQPKDISTIQRLYSIKELLAYKASAREVRNYALYDEEFLKVMRWNPHNALSLRNPVSELMARLVTSLVPNLFKNIYANKTYDETLNFFEWNKIWSRGLQTEKIETAVIEHNSLAGIFFHEKAFVDFYQTKQILVTIFTMLGIEIEWVKTDHDVAPWYHPYKTAHLVHNGTVIGIAGSVNPGFLAHFLSGDAFIFELNGDLLLRIPAKKIVFKPLAKYQDTWRDISMLAPLPLTVKQLSDTILKTSSDIFNVELIDFFQKEEWIDKRSITLRFYARDSDKTLSSQDIDLLYEHVLKALVPLGIEVR